MRQSRHLGMFNNNADLAELAGDIAITLYEKKLVYRYDQQKRKGFLTILIQNATNSIENDIKFNRPYSLEDLKNIDESNFLDYCKGVFAQNQNSCDCSSFVAAVWYLTFLFAKTNINFTYGILDNNELSTHYVYRNKPIKLNNFSNTYTTFNIADFFQNYGFEYIDDADFTKEQLQKGDILVRNLNDTQNGGRIGHTAICIGEYKTYTKDNPAMIQCAGSTGNNGQPSDLNTGYKSPHECALSCDPVDYFFYDNNLYNNSNDSSFVLRIKHNRRKKGQDISLYDYFEKINYSPNFYYRNTLISEEWQQGTGGTDDYVVGTLRDNNQNGTGEVCITLHLQNGKDTKNCTQIEVEINNIYLSHGDVIGNYKFCLSSFNLYTYDGAKNISFKDFKANYEQTIEKSQGETDGNITDSSFSEDIDYHSQQDMRGNIKMTFTNIPPFDNNDNLYLYLYSNHTNIKNYHFQKQSNITVGYNYLTTTKQDNNDDTNG